MGSEVVELDRKDREILTLLQEDASLPMADVAARVGLSPSPCWRRVRRMEEAGVIKGRVALVDRSKVGPSLTAYAFISLERHEDNVIDQFHEAIRS
ncbi:MAG: Lrp/AsnC family transcriptional regulator, partial [Myxococcota bacterium]